MALGTLHPITRYGGHQCLDLVQGGSWKALPSTKKSATILLSLHLHISLDRKHKRPTITQHRQMWTPDVAEAAAQTITRASRVT